MLSRDLDNPQSLIPELVEVTAAWDGRTQVFTGHLPQGNSDS
jgi:hypothetical protein